MKNIVVLVKKDEVITAVAREVAYIGAKQTTAEADMYNALHLVKEDSEEINKIFKESLDGLFSQLNPWLVDFLPSLDILLHVPLNFDFAQFETLKRLIYDYLMNVMVSEWLTIYALADNAKVYDDKATAQLDLIKATLNKRVRPLPPLYDEEHEIIPRRKHPEQ